MILTSVRQFVSDNFNTHMLRRNLVGELRFSDEDEELIVAVDTSFGSQVATQTTDSRQLSGTPSTHPVLACSGSPLALSLRGKRTRVADSLFLSLW